VRNICKVRDIKSAWQEFCMSLLWGRVSLSGPIMDQRNDTLKDQGTTACSSMNRGRKVSFIPRRHDLSGWIISRDM
jgi:hypothetical protein